MNENVKSEGIINGRNGRAIFFAVAICALMLLSSFSVLGSALAAGPSSDTDAADTSGGMTPVEDAQSQPTASDDASGADVASDATVTTDPSIVDSSYFISPTQNNINAEELKEMLAQLEASGSYSKGLTPTPTVSITLQGFKASLGDQGNDTSLIQFIPTMNDGGDLILTGTFAGLQVNGLVSFNLNNYIDKHFQDLLLDANFGIFLTPVASAPVLPIALPVAASWTEYGATWNTRDGVTPWLSPGGDFIITPLFLTGAGLGTWYTVNVRPVATSWLDTTLPNNGLLILDPIPVGLELWESSELIWSSGNPAYAPYLSLSFLSVESHASTLAPIYETQEFNIPYNATTIEANGIDHMNLYYRFSPDNGTTVPWTPWTLHTVIPGAGAYHIEGNILFNASAGMGEYQFFTEAVTVDGSVEMDPTVADAETFYHQIGPFPPTNIKCWNNGLNANVVVSWNLSISSPDNLYYFISWADSPKWIDFSNPFNTTNVGLSNTTTSALFLGAANDLIPDYYVVKAFVNVGPGYWSNNTDSVVNRDVYYLNLRPPYTGIDFVFRNMTVAGSTLTVSNSNLGFDWIKVNAAGNLIMNSCDLVINGDLTIMGDVILNNVNLIMNGSYDGESMIYVAPGATLTINGGTVTNGAMDANYLFKVGGSLTMTNANLTRCGSRNQTALDEAGLFVSGSATLDGVWIHDCLVGVIAGEAATSVLVQNSMIQNCGIGAMSYGSSALSLHDNGILNCGGSLIQDGTVPVNLFFDDVEAGLGTWSWNSQSDPTYVFDCESGEDGWTHGGGVGPGYGPDLWHISSANSNTGSYSWRDASDGTNDYDFGSIIYNWLISPTIDLTSTTDPVFSYWEWRDTEGWPFDASYVYFSDDDGATWTSVTAYSGGTGWRYQPFHITDYVTITNQFRVNFTFNTGDNLFNSYRGWFIDDIRIGETGGYMWEQTTSESNSPTHSWTDSDGANYINNQDLWLANSVDISDPALQFATLEFSAMYSIGAGDKFFTEISADGGATWTILGTKTGVSSGYGTGTFTTVSYSLDDWLGTPNLQFRFRMNSNSSITGDGIYIDDIAVIGEYPRAYISGGAVGAFSNYADTLNSVVDLTNNIILDSINYALLTDANSRMDWLVNDQAECSNSGPMASIDINGDIKVTGSGSDLMISNTAVVCNQIGIDAGASAWLIDSNVGTGNITVAGTLWDNDTLMAIDSAYPGENHIQVTGNMFIQGGIISSANPNAFTFWVEDSANFSMNGCLVTNCGHSSGVVRDYGLYIATDNASVIGSTITGCYVGIIANGSSPFIFASTISNNFAGVYCLMNATPIIDTNIINLNTQFGVIASYNSEPQVLNNAINSNGMFGVLFANDMTDINVTIIDNTVSNNGMAGIAIVTRGYLNGSIDANTVNSNTLGGIMIADDVPFEYWVNLSISGNDVISNGGTGISITNPSTVDLVFDYNDLIANVGAGLFISAIDRLNIAGAYDNAIANSGNGISLTCAGNISASILSSNMIINGVNGVEITSGADVIVSVTDCDIEDNSGNGVGIVNVGTSFVSFNNTYFDGNSANGIYVESAEIVSPIITNNWIYDSGNDGIFLNSEIGISDANIDGNIIESSNAIGMYLYVDLYGNITGTISDNSVNSSGAVGIFVETSFGDIDVDVTDNYADYCDDTGISILADVGNISALVLNNSAIGASNLGIMILSWNNASVSAQGNDVSEAGFIGLYVSSLGTLSGDVSGNTAYDSLLGIMVGDPAFMSPAPPINLDMTIADNNVSECAIGIISFAEDNYTAVIDGNLVYNNGDGIFAISANATHIDSRNNVVVGNFGAPVEVGYYISSEGDLNLTSVNDTCSMNDYIGMQIEMGGNLNAVFDLCAFDDNGDEGLVIYSSDFGYVDVQMSNTHANGNFGEGGILIDVMNNMATVDLVNVTAEGNSGIGLNVTAATDLFLTGDGVYMNANGNGGMAGMCGIATVSLNDTMASGNGGVGILFASSEMFFTICNSTVDSNSAIGIWLSTFDMTLLSMTNLDVSGNLGTNIVVDSLGVSGTMDNVSAGNSISGSGLDINAGGDLDINILNSSFNSNLLNGVEISGSTLTVDIINTDVFSNDPGWATGGSGISLIGLNIYANMSDDEIYFNGAQGINLVADYISLETDNVIADSNRYNGLNADANVGMDLNLTDSDFGYNYNGDGINVQSDGWMTIALTGCYLYGNNQNGLEAVCNNNNLLDIDIVSTTFNWNGWSGIRAVSLGWVYLNVGGGSWVEYSASLTPASGIYVSGDGASVNISDSYVYWNYGPGIDIDAQSAIDINGNTVDMLVHSSQISYNGGDGINIDSVGWTTLTVEEGSYLDGNSGDAIDVDTDSAIWATLDSSAVRWSSYDGLNLSATGYAYCYLTGSYVEYNGNNGIHVDSYDVDVYDTNTIVYDNDYDGIDVSASNYANIDVWNAFSTTLHGNGLNGMHAIGDVVDVYFDSGVECSYNGECGLNITAFSYTQMNIQDTTFYSNGNDGISANAGDVNFYTENIYSGSNGANGIDFVATDEIYVTAPWALDLEYNVEDGMNLTAGNYVYLSAESNPIYMMYNGNDGLDVNSGNDCAIYIISSSNFDNNMWSGVNITAADYINLELVGYPWDYCSFDYNGEHGIYANSDSMDATINYVSASSNGGRGIWLTTNDDISPDLTSVVAIWNGDDGALIQSVNGWVYPTVFDSSFTGNDGDGLAILAINGGIEAYVDNCFLDMNGGNGLYLFGQNVSLYPGLSVANSYSMNGMDGIHVEATWFAYMEANLLTSSDNMGNGITMIAPDGEIWLVQVSCDGNQNGIYLDGAIQGEIDSSSTDYNADAGISVNGGYNLWIHDSYASYNSVVGMEMYDCTNIYIENNYLEYNGVGIYINNTSDSTIVNNDVHYNFLDGIDVVNGSDVTLINNMITFNFGWGIFSEPGVNIEWIADSSYDGEYAYAKMNDILLWGNITVVDFSLMTLEDLTTTIGTNMNLQRNIEIYSDGLMNLNDATIQALGSYWYYFDVWGMLDTDFATIQGAWEVRAYANSQLNILRSSILDAGLYGIRAEDGSFVNVLDSYFSGCGFSGMYIESNTVMVSGTTFDDNYRGIWLVNVGPINIEDCSFIDNDRDGILVDDSFVTIPFCSFEGNGRGVRVDNDGVGLIENCWFGSNDVGVDLLNNGFADVRLSDFDDNDVGFYLDTFSYAWVENCTMDSLVQEFSQRGDSLAQTLNTVFSGPTYIIDNSELIVLWYLDVEVLDEAFDPIPGAVVDIWDGNGNYLFSELTDSDGMVRWIICVDYIKMDGVVDNSMNPHTIVVDDGIASDSRDVVIDGTMTQTFVLNHPPAYVPGSMSDVSFDQGLWITDAFNLNDCFTDKGYLHFTDYGSSMIDVWISYDGWVSFSAIDPDWSGSELITFRATDEDGLYVEHTILVTVLRINTPPEITSTPVVTGAQGVQYYYAVTATDIDIPYGDSLTFWLSIAPVGMSIDGSTGLISWIPAYDQVGIAWVMVYVGDANGGTDSQLYAISVANVNDAPTITSTPSSTSATEGSLYTGTVTATDLDSLYGEVLTFSLTTSPAGMVIDPVTGIIYWTPAYNQVGSNLVVVKVTDIGGLYDTAAFTIDVANVNQAPTITSTPIASATQGALYYYQVTATDLDLVYGDTLTFSLSESPAGMTINPATGLIAWVPNATQIGMTWVTVTVTDSAAESASQQYMIIVANVNDAPTITSTAIITAAANVLYIYDVNATDLDTAFGDILVFSLTTAPAGMSIDASTGLIQWMPNTHSPSPVTVVVRVTDSGGLSDTQSYQITVSGLNHAPSITSVALSPSVAYAGTTINASAVGWSDAEGDSAQYLYQWYINGEAVGGANGNDLSGLFVKGDIVSCMITPYDGKEYGTPVESEGIVISNSAPSIEEASITPVTPIMKDTLSVFLSGVHDADPLDEVVFLYQWQVYNTTTSQWDDILGATSDSLSLNTLKVGDKVRCIVTPFDGTVDGESVTTNEVTLKETPGAFPAAEIATISGLLFATLFFAVLVLYILGKIGKKKGDEEEPAAPEDEKAGKK